MQAMLTNTGQSQQLVHKHRRKTSTTISHTYNYHLINNN